MELKSFAYWLQGFFELHGSETALTVEQVNIIRNHLALVFQHDIDPKAGNEEVQKKLNAIHNDIRVRPPGSTVLRC